MTSVAPSPASSKLPSVPRRRAQRVVISDFASYIRFRRQVDLAELGLQRAQEARASDELNGAIRLVRHYGRAASRLFAASSFGPALGVRYAEQAARLVEVARAVDELEREASVPGCVVQLDAFRARRTERS